MAVQPGPAIVEGEGGVRAINNEVNLYVDPDDPAMRALTDACELQGEVTVKKKKEFEPRHRGLYRGPAGSSARRRWPFRSPR